jgi:hypothetical protein
MRHASEQLQFRVSPARKRLIQKAAADNNTTVAGLIKTLIDDFSRERGYIGKQRRPAETA